MLCNENELNIVIFNYFPSNNTNSMKFNSFSQPYYNSLNRDHQPASQEHNSMFIKHNLCPHMLYKTNNKPN